MPERGLLKELAMSVGKGWFAVAIGVLFAAYGAVELIAHAKTSGWVWISAAFAVAVAISLNVAYQALRERDAAVAGVAPSVSTQSSVVIHGGEHNYYYGGPPSPERPGDAAKSS